MARLLAILMAIIIAIVIITEFGHVLPYASIAEA